MISGRDLFKILGDTVDGRTLKYQVKRRMDGLRFSKVTTPIQARHVAAV